MRKNSFSVLIAIAILGLLMGSCKNDKRTNNIDLLAVDTLILPVKKAYRINARYDSEEEKDYVTYIDSEQDEINLILIDKNKQQERHVFPYKQALIDAKAGRWGYFYYFTDYNTVSLFIEKDKPEGLIYTILNISETGDWKEYNLVNKTSRDYRFQIPIYPFSISKNGMKNLYISTVFPFVNSGEKPLNDYQTNNQSRLEVFSEASTILIELNDSSGQIIKEFGKYPEIFLDTSVIFYYYFPSYTVMNNKSILYLYRELDTLYEFDINKLGLSKHPFAPKYKTEHVSFDMKELYNYDYISKWACESSCPLYIKYNANLNSTFVIYKLAVDYVNDDGTVNRAIDNPFSIIMFDSLLNQIFEKKIPDNYSKHNSFPVANGIALLNTSLTKNNKDQYATYVIFALKEISNENN
jgi:hypothetical protein